MASHEENKLSLPGEKYLNETMQIKEHSGRQMWISDLEPGQT